MNYFLGVELKGNLLKISAFKKSRQLYDLFKLDSFELPIEANEASRQLALWIERNLPDAISIKAVLTVSESGLYIKVLEFPKMPDEKLNEAVYWEIPSVAPIPQSDAVFDWQVLSEDKGMLNVLVIVGKASHIQNIILTFRNAQIDIVAIEPSSYAFARIANAPFDNNTLLCLAEEKGTDFIILKNGIPLFTTSSTGNTQSEKVRKIKSGLDLTDDIVAEGKKIINYWESKESSKIHQVVVAGDLVYKYIGLSAALNLFPPITTYIGTNKKIKLLKTDNYKEADLVGYLISLGAGVRHLQKEVIEGINLFPPAEKQKTEKIRAQKKATSQLMTAVYMNSFILIILVVSILGLNVWWYSLERQLDKLNETLSNQQANGLLEEIRDTNLAIQNVNSLVKKQVNFGDKLKAISDMTPNSLKLTSVNLVNTKSQEWTVEGIGDRDSILAYYEKISQNSGAKEVTMPYSNFNKGADNEFSISIIW